MGVVKKTPWDAKQPAPGRTTEKLQPGRIVSIAFRPGEPFNPYRMFTGLFIPEGLARCPWISAGAKLAWGRLARYAGVDGQCYPTVKTLGAEIGVGDRQAQKYLAELEQAMLLRRVSRFARRAQTSNAFEFLWHELFVRGVNDRSGEGVNDHSPGGVNDSSPEESHLEESHVEEQHRLRLSGHESQKPRFAPGGQAARCKRYPNLQEALADYMQEGPSDERIYPTERVVVDIMDAAQRASESDVIECLRYLREERGLRPGTRNGPRHFAWFRTVVGDYFAQKTERRLPPAAEAGSGHGSPGGLTGAAFDAMTEAF